jgi:hypothetical protein
VAYGRLEDWKDGREHRKGGRLEGKGWKNGSLEGKRWKDGRVGE